MRYYGLLGEKLGHSFSPIIHKNILKEIKIDGQYKLFECKKEDFKEKVHDLKKSTIHGLNITIPYKLEIMKYLDDISQEVKKIGAINTISFNDGKAFGYNTDYHGFGMMLKREDISIKNKRSLVLGSGGASKAVVQYLLDNGIGKIIIASRDPDKTKGEYLDFQVIDYKTIKKLRGYDIIINTTPRGMFPHIDNSPVNKDELSNFHTAIDLIYNPHETLFLKHAKEMDLKSINGLYMLVGQAIKAQEIWNELEIDQDACNRIYRKIFNHKI